MFINVIHPKCLARNLTLELLSTLNLVFIITSVRNLGFEPKCKLATFLCFCDDYFAPYNLAAAPKLFLRRIYWNLIFLAEYHFFPVDLQLISILTFLEWWGIVLAIWGVLVWSRLFELQGCASLQGLPPFAPPHQLNNPAPSPLPGTSISDTDIGVALSITASI